MTIRLKNNITIYNIQAILVNNDKFEAIDNNGKEFILTLNEIEAIVNS